MLVTNSLRRVHVPHCSYRPGNTSGSRNVQKGGPRNKASVASEL